MTTDTLTIRTPDALVLAGRTANDAAARVVFTDYRERKAANTLRRQDAGLALFADFLATVGIEAGELAQDPQAWTSYTWPRWWPLTVPAVLRGTEKAGEDLRHCR